MKKNIFRRLYRNEKSKIIWPRYCSDGSNLLALGACGGGSGSTDSSGGAAKEDAKHSVAIVTDIGGVDDRSFNQTAWEGLQAWGKEHKLEKGNGGYNYIQSNDASEYATKYLTSCFKWI